MSPEDIDPEVWLTVARRELGQREVPGEPSNPRILLYHDATTLHATADEVPWCSAFVNWVLAEVGIEGTRSAAARSWLHWGQHFTIPRAGSIVVLRRGRSTWQGHVGFCVDREGRPLLLAGNQNNRVSIAPYDPARVLGYQWPLQGKTHG